MGDIKVITNGVPRDVIDAAELTPAERAEFDYLDWDAVDRGEANASFVRYHGDLLDLGCFTAGNGVGQDSGLPDHLSKWDGHMGDSYFSATLVRFVENGERVIIGRMST